EAAHVPHDLRYRLGHRRHQPDARLRHSRLHKQLIKSTAGLGDRIVIAWPGLTSIPYEGLGKGRRIRVREDDLTAIRGNVPGLKAVSGEYSNNMKVVYGTKTLAVDTSGVVPDFGAMRNMIPQLGGRFIDAVDYKEQRRAAVLGNKLAKDLFGGTPAVGKMINVNHWPFLVVGVLQEKDQDSNYSGPHDQKMFIPSTTFRALSGNKYVDNFVFQAANSEETKQVIKRVSAALGKRLRFDAG